VDKDEAVTIAQTAVGLAIEAGASQAEGSVAIGRRFSAEARGGTITKLEQSTGKGLALRLFVDGRKATLATADFEREALRRAVARTVAQAEHVAEDRFAGLPDESADEVSDLGLYDDGIADRAESAGADDALAIERELSASDARITNSNGSRYSDGVSITALANSHGFFGAYVSTRASRSASPVALDGERKRTAHYGTAGRKLTALDSNKEVARIATQHALEMFGATKPPTMRVPVIFERDVAAAVLSDVFAAISAANVALDNSWLAGRVGERIGSDRVTLVDDGRLPGLLGSSPFDGEGVATRRTTVMERGVLRTFLYDSYHARKLGTTSTGNSSGGSIGPNTFFLEAGEQSLEELIASTPRGVLVLDTIGFSTEHATGSYSRGARGMLIVGGELAGPIDEFTIAASLPEMLAGVDAVANDLRFDGSVVAPSFRVCEMTVSGN
jgi:PmbA protein